MRQQRVKTLPRDLGLVGMRCWPGHAQVAGEAALVVEAGQAAQPPGAGLRVAIGLAGAVLLHQQFPQCRLRLHARLQAVLDIVEAVPEQITAEGAARPGRSGRALRWLQFHQPVLGIGLPAPHVEHLAQQLGMQACAAQAVKLALAAPEGAGQQRPGATGQQGQRHQPCRQHALPGRHGVIGAAAWPATARPEPGPGGTCQSDQQRKGTTCQTLYESAICRSVGRPRPLKLHGG